MNPPQPSPATLPAGQDPGRNDAASTTSTGAVPVLNDNDKIEKEWVNKVKQIVERTRNDPYRQNEELTVVKADYMQQRYNKTIKVDK